MYIPLTFEGALSKCLYASGGIEGSFISGSTQYNWHLFTQSADLTVLKGTIDAVRIYIIGGGGGGAADDDSAGGGGAGEAKILTNQRLFGGVYTMGVGAGGAGYDRNNIPSNGNGSAGGTSTLSGPAMFYQAVGGQGGEAGNGNSGGDSGNAYSGGLNVSGFGGGGGGSIQNGYAGNAGIGLNGNGGSGSYLQVAGTYNICFAAGGGGDGSAAGVGIEGCPSAGGGNGGNAVEKIYGGGGGGGRPSDLKSGGNGGSGSIYVEYPVYDYCNNYFNETGSCDCRQLTFNINAPLNPETELRGTGSYYYTPCGTTVLESGSLFSGFPVTVCASYDTWYAVDTIQPFGATSSFATTGPECVSQSAACTTQQYFPTSSVIQNFKASAGAGGASRLAFLAKNENTITSASISANTNFYFCAQTGAAWIPLFITPGTGNTITSSSIDICTPVTASCANCGWYTISGGPGTVVYNPCNNSNLVQSYGTGTSYIAVNLDRGVFTDGRTATNLNAGTVVATCATCSFSSSVSYTTNSLSLWHRCDTYFSMSVSGSATWYDSSTNGNIGTWVSTLTSSALPAKEGVINKGNNANADLRLKWLNNNQTLVASPSSSFSLEVVGGPYTGNMRFIRKGNVTGDDESWDIKVETGSPQRVAIFRRFSGTSRTIYLNFTGSINFATGSSHQIDVTVDKTSNTASMYYNGAFQNSTGSTFLPSFTQSTGSLWGLSDAYKTKNISVWYKPLTGTEVQTNYDYLSSLVSCSCNTGSI